MNPISLAKTFVAGMTVAAVQTSLNSLSLFTLRNPPDTLQVVTDQKIAEHQQKSRASRVADDKVLQLGLSKGNWKAVFPDHFPSLNRGNQTAKFAYATRNLNLSQILQGKNILPNEKEQLVSALLAGDWQADIFQEGDRYLYVALAAFQNGDIGAEEFTNVMLYGAVRQDYSPGEIQVKRLYDRSGKLDVKVAELLFKTMNLHDMNQIGNLDRLPHDSGLSLLSSDQKLAFLHLLSKQPASAHTFFMVPERSGPEYSFEKRHYKTTNQTTITETLHYRVGFQVFNRVIIEGQTFCLVPSYELMQIFLNVSSEKPVQLQTSVGISTFEEIQSNGCGHKRDFMVPGYGLNNPDKIDGLLAPKAYEGSIHDFYHAHRANNIPHPDQRRFIAMSQRFAKPDPQFTSFKMVRLFAELFAHSLADMEFGNTYSVTERNPVLNGDPVFTSARGSMFLSLMIAEASAIGNFVTIEGKKEADPKAGIKPVMPKALLQLVKEVVASRFFRKSADGILASLNPTRFRINFCRELLRFGNAFEKELNKSGLSMVTTSIFLNEMVNRCRNPWLIASLPKQLQ